MPVATEEQVIAASQQLLSRGLKNLIVTLGEKGALWLRGNEQDLLPAPQVQAVDTTGAGDAFIGCFAHALATGADIADAILAANLYAAHSVTGKGTQTSYANASEFAALVAES